MLSFKLYERIHFHIEKSRIKSFLQYSDIVKEETVFLYLKVN